MSNSCWKSWTYCTRYMSYTSIQHNTQEHSACPEHKALLFQSQPAYHILNYPDWGNSQKHRRHFRLCPCSKKNKQSPNLSKISEQCKFLNSLHGAAWTSTSRNEGEHTAWLLQEASSHWTRVINLLLLCCRTAPSDGPTSYNLFIKTFSLFKIRKRK